MADNVKTLFPGRDIEVGGEKLTLLPYPFGKLPKVIGRLGEIIHILVSTPPDIMNLIMTPNKWKDQPEIMGYLASMINICGESVLELMALSIDKPREWVDQLPADEGFELFIVMLEQNIDFFNKRFAPTIANLNTRARSIGDQLIPIPKTGEGSSQS